MQALSEDRTGVSWPQEHVPDGADIFAVNELAMDVPPEAVWAWLVRPDLWSTFYSNARGVKHASGPWPELAPGSTWTWWTFGARVKTTITEFEPFERLAWTGEGLGSVGHHAWLFEPRPKGGCHVTSPETQRGLPVKILGPALRPAMRHFHQNWLEGLERVAAIGPPPSPNPD